MPRRPKARQNKAGKQQETSIAKPETSIVKPETNIVKPETSIVKPETSIVKPKTSIVKPETSIAKTETGIAKTQLRCNTCQKTTSAPGISELKCCARCNSAHYCSAVCQKTDWKEHKKVCQPSLSLKTTSITSTATTTSITAESPATPEASRPVPESLTPPPTPTCNKSIPGVTEELSGDWKHDLDVGFAEDVLHRLPELSVYTWLVDLYRLRSTKLRQLNSARSLSASTFSEMLDRAERAPKLTCGKTLLPDWWNSAHRAKCEEFAAERVDKQATRRMDVEFPLGSVSQVYLQDRYYREKLWFVVARVYGVWDTVFGGSGKAPWVE